MTSKKLLRIIIVGISFLALFSGNLYTNQLANAHFVDPKEGDVCPICEMAISEHTLWVAVIMFSDGKHVKLHGPKSMFTYYFNLENYDKKYKKKNVSTLHVTDYYTLKHIRAEEAYYVINSNMLGPMGAELVPFKNLASAKSFIKEYGGEILSYENITPEIVSSLQDIISDIPSTNH